MNISAKVCRGQHKVKTRDIQFTLQNFYTKGITHQKLLKHMKAIVSRLSLLEIKFPLFKLLKSNMHNILPSMRILDTALNENM